MGMSATTERSDTPGDIHGDGEAHPQPSHFGVVGGGTMGLGIAYVTAFAGHHVTVVEPSDRQAEQMMAEIGAAAHDAVRRGRLERADPLLGRIGRVSAVGDLARDLELVIESVPERIELKREVLAEISGRSPKLIGSNTSSISISSLASAVADPGCFIGTHFFNPVWSLPLVELVRGHETSSETVAATQLLMESLGKQTIVVADIAGFATSRLDLAAALEAMRMLDDGVTSAEEIDCAAVLAYRHPVGPLRLSDIVGLDVRLDIARQLEQVHGPRFTPPAVLERLVAEGHLGRKSGRGFYEWTGES
jgi:3-hydroxybutyryl-CoA dehydrogenase